MTVTAYPPPRVSLAQAIARAAASTRSWWPLTRRRARATLADLMTVQDYLSRIEGGVFVRDGDFTAPELGEHRPPRDLGMVQGDDTLSMFMGPLGLFVGTVDGLRTYQP